MRHGLITFRSHPLDKNLDDYWLTLLQPLLKKQKKYLLGIDKRNTLEQHFHLIISGPDSMDITNLRKKFTGKTFKQFYNKIKNEQLSTWVDPKFLKGNLNIELVGLTLEDHLKVVGYCAKEHIHSSLDYTDDEITDSIKYHFATQRLDNTKPLENNWKIPSNKTALAIYEDFSKTTGIPASDSTFFLEATRSGICHMNVTDRALSIMRSSLILRNEKPPENEFLHSFHSAVIEPDDKMKDIVQTLNMGERIEYLEKLLNQNNISFDK